MTTIISGTNRPHSKSLSLSKYYQEQFLLHQFTTQLVALDQLPKHLIDTDLYGKRSKEFEPFQQLVHRTEKFVFIVPEYNGSFPGILKTFIDCCEYPSSFKGKKAALVGLSAGRGGNVNGLIHFSGVCTYLGIQVMESTVSIPFVRSEISPEGQLLIQETQQKIAHHVQEIIQF